MIKTINKLSIVLLLMFVVCVGTKANSVKTIDGIKYSINTEENNATVVPINSKYSGDITIPEKVTFSGKEYPVVALADECFSMCDSLTSITIPSSVATIGNECFVYCSSLTTINIPSSVIAIGNECFVYCSSLTTINIPSSITAIGDECFGYCSNLTSVTIPSSVTAIGNECFRNCRSLTSVTIPSSVTAIGNFCFDGCNSLTSVTIPSSITAIGNMCFRDCSNLLSLTCYAEGLSLLNIPNLSSMCQIYVPKARQDYYKQALTKYKYIYAIDEV